MSPVQPEATIHFALHVSTHPLTQRINLDYLVSMLCYVRPLVHTTELYLIRCTGYGVLTRSIVSWA